MRFASRLSWGAVKQACLDGVLHGQAWLAPKLFSLPGAKRLFGFLLHDIVSAERSPNPEAHGIVAIERIAGPCTVDLHQLHQRRVLEAGGYPATFTIPVQARYTIRDAFLSLRRGVVCNARGSIIEESVAISRKTGRRIHDTGIYGMPKPFRAPRLQGTYATVWGTYGPNYYHWLVDCLPRIALLEEVARRQQIRMVMPRLPAAHKDSLECCLPEGVPVDYLDDKGWVQLERLVLPSFATVGSIAYPPRRYLDYVRAGVFRRYGLHPEQRGTRRIYISRAAANFRRILNEDAVHRALEGQGFTIVHMERLSFEDQVRTIHGAGVIVAPHGAGLANLMFAGPVSVLELCGDRFHGFFYYLAQALGQRHHHLVGRGLARMGDFEIDIAKLDTAVSDLVREADSASS